MSEISVTTRKTEDNEYAAQRDCFRHTQSRRWKRWPALERREPILRLVLWQLVHFQNSNLAGRLFQLFYRLADTACDRSPNWPWKVGMERRNHL